MTHSPGCPIAFCQRRRGSKQDVCVLEDYWGSGGPAKTSVLHIENSASREFREKLTARAHHCGPAYRCVSGCPLTATSHSGARLDTILNKTGRLVVPLLADSERAGVGDSVPTR